jgi:hypothetical protein
VQPPAQSAARHVLLCGRLSSGVQPVTPKAQHLKPNA